MAFIVAETSQNKERELIPAETHQAVCYSIIEIGTEEFVYMGETKKSKKVKITFELPNELRVFDEEKGEQPMVIGKDFTISLSEKSNLRAFLESWRGKKFTDDELKGFDLSNLIGANCLIVVGQEVNQKNGKTYNSLMSISPLMKGMKKADPINQTILLSYSDFDWSVYDALPNFIKEKMANTPEFKALAPRLQTEANEVADMEFTPIQNLPNE
jgi:hypothetical protein